MRLFILLLCSHCLIAAEGIGPLSSLEGLRFSGTGPFEAAELRLALLSNPETLLALHPLSPWSQAQEAIVGGLERGYRSSGFPEVSVTVGVPAGGEVAVGIERGPRFHCGELRVIGSDEAEVIALLRDALLLPYDEETGAPIRSDERSDDHQEPLWPRDQGAPFHRGGLDGIRNRLLTSLAGEGWYQPRFGLLLERDPAAGLAHLRIQIDALGDRRPIREILVSGIERNSREAVLAHGGLAVGDMLGNKALQAARRALVASGCFLSVAVRPDPEQEGVVLITLVEHEHLPLLGEEPGAALGAAQQAMRWVVPALGSGAWDLSVHIDLPAYGSGELVLAPGRGLYLAYAPLGGEPAFLLVEPERILLRGPDGERLQAAFEGGLQLHLAVQAQPPGEDGRTRNLNVNAGYQGGSTVPILMDLVAEPAVLDRRMFAAAAVETVDGATRIQATGVGEDAAAEMTWLVEADDRLRQLDYRRDGRSLQVSCQQGRFAERRRGWGEPGAAVPLPLLLAQLGTAVGRPLAATLSDDPDFGRGLDAAGALLSAAGPVLSERWRRWFPEGAAEEADDFGIPMHRQLPAGTTGIIAMALPVVHGLSLRVAPYDHWLPTVTREATRIFFGRQDHVGAELKRLYNDPALGPAGCTVIAWLLRDAEPTMSEIFADLARERADAAAFRREMAPLFDDLDQALLPLLRIIADQAQLPDLALLLPAGDHRQELRADLEAVQTRAAELLDDSQAEAGVLAELLWQGGVDKLVQSLLPSGPPVP